MTGLDRAAGWAGLGVLVAALVRLDLRPLELVLLVPSLLVAVLAPGSLLLRLTGAPGLSGGERILMAALLGYPASSALHYFLSLLGLGALYLPVLLAAAAAALLLRFLRPVEARSAPAWIGRWLLFAAVAVLVHTRGHRAFTSLDGGSLLYDHGFDPLIHVAFLWELLRGVPPAELPATAGVPFPHYHVFGYMLGVALARHAGLGAVTTYHAVLPALHLLLLGAGITLAVRLRTGDRRLGLAAAVAAFLVAGALDRVVRGLFVVAPPALEYLVRSVSGGGGAAVWGAVFALLAFHDRLRGEGRATPARRSLLLAGGLVGLSYFFKAPMLAVFGGAFLLALALQALREGPRPHVAPAALAAALVLATLLSWRTTSSFGRLAWAPGAFAAQRVEPALAAPLGGALHRLGEPAAGVLATALGLWRFLNCSLVWPLWWIDRLRRWRSLGATDAALLFVTPLAAAAAYGLAAEDYEGIESVQLAAEVLYSLPLLAAAVDACAIAALLDRRGLDGGRVVQAGVLGAALLVAPAWLWTRSESRTHALRLGPGEVRALDYLRRETPLDAVVVERGSVLPLDPSAGRRHAVIAGLAGRRSVCEYYDDDALSRIDPGRDRLGDVRRLFTTARWRTAREILERYGVDYVVEDARAPLRFETKGLALAHEDAGVRVWRVERRTRPLDGRPGFGIPEGLR